MTPHDAKAILEEVARRKAERALLDKVLWGMFELTGRAQDHVPVGVLHQMVSDALGGLTTQRPEFRRSVTRAVCAKTVRWCGKDVSSRIVLIHGFRYFRGVKLIDQAA